MVMLARGKNSGHLLLWKKVQLDLPYRPTLSTTIEHGVLLGMYEMKPNFACMWAYSWKASMQNLKEFGHRMHIVSRSVSILGSFD